MLLLGQQHYWERPARLEDAIHHNDQSSVYGLLCNADSGRKVQYVKSTYGDIISCLSDLEPIWGGGGGFFRSIREEWNPRREKGKSFKLS